MIDYVIVCKNQTQATFIANKLLSYAVTCNSSLLANCDDHAYCIWDGTTGVTIMPERILFDFTNQRRLFNACLVSVKYVEEWLDKHEKKKKKPDFTNHDGSHDYD